SDSSTSSTDHLSADTIAAKIKDLEAASDADQPDRAALLELYRQALDDVKRSDEEHARAAELEKQRIAAPYQLEVLKRQHAAKAPAQPAKSLPGPPDSPLASWEQSLAGAEHDLETAQKALDDKESEEQQRAAHRVEIPQAIAAARVKLDELQQSG